MTKRAPLQRTAVYLLAVVVMIMYLSYKGTLHKGGAAEYTTTPLVIPQKSTSNYIAPNDTEYLKSLSAYWESTLEREGQSLQIMGEPPTRNSNTGEKKTIGVKESTGLPCNQIILHWDSNGTLEEAECLSKNNNN